MSFSRLLTVKQLAPMLGVHPKRVYEIKDQIPGLVCLGDRQYRWSERKVREFLDGDIPLQDADKAAKKAA